MNSFRVLVVTNMWPDEPNPSYGSFVEFRCNPQSNVQNVIRALRSEAYLFGEAK
jgi:hypothetical protein